MSELYIEGIIALDGDMWLYNWFGEKALSPGMLADALKKSGGGDLTMWIDSPGGSLWAGARMYTELCNYPGHKTVKISGLAASAASVVAMAGDMVLMSPTAQMMIHNAHTTIEGDYRDAENAAQMLTEANASIINAYVRKTGKSADALREMMDKETYMSADTAIEHGFADGKLFDLSVAASMAGDVTARLRERYNQEAERAAALIAIERMRI